MRFILIRIIICCLNPDSKSNKSFSISCLSQDISVHDLCQRTSFSRPTANNLTRLATVLIFLLYLTILFDVFGFGFYLDCAYIVYFHPCNHLTLRKVPSQILYVSPLAGNSPPYTKFFKNILPHVYYRFWWVFSPSQDSHCRNVYLFLSV